MRAGPRRNSPAAARRSAGTTPRTYSPPRGLPGQSMDASVRCRILKLVTRGDVARYLGKSVATVRRAEGRHLHPRRDANGVHHFRFEEVKALRDAVARGDVRLTNVNFADHVRTGPRIEADASETIGELRAEVAELRACARTAVELFFDVCPLEILRELDEHTLVVFEAVLNDR